MQYNLDLHELLVYVSMQLAVQVKLMKYQNDSYSVAREFFLMCFKFKSGYTMNLRYVSSDEEQCNRVWDIMISRALCISVQLAVQIKLMKYDPSVHLEIYICSNNTGYFL